MNHGLGQRVIALLPLLLSACVTSPKSNTSIDGPTVDFEGIYDKAGAKISIQAEESDGSWTTLATEKVRSDGHWTVHVTVPSRFLSTGSCAPVSFRAISNKSPDPLPAADADCLSELGPDATTEERLECATDVITLSPPQTYTGDLTIVGQAQADEYSCITKVDGDLTIDAGGDRATPSFGWLSRQTFSMPSLREVTGDLVLDGGHVETLTMTGLERVGGSFVGRFRTFTAFIPPGPGESEPSDWHWALPEVSFPAFASVGANLALHYGFEEDSGPSSAMLFDSGMPLLASVGGDVLVDNQSHPARLFGLPALTHIRGNFTLRWPGSDLSGGILDNLTVVDGDIDTYTHSNTETLCPNLTHVGGSVRFHEGESTPYIHASTFSALARIDGDLVFDARVATSSPFFGCGVLQSLTEVGGTLRMNDSLVMNRVGSPGGLAVGAIEMQGGPATFVPLPETVTIAVGGAVTLRDNENLCPCEADAFAANLSSHGWSGTLTSSGNGTAVTCPATCTLTPACPP